MASQVAFQDTVVVKIKSERDAPSSHCTESRGTANVESPKLRVRLAGTDRLVHNRQQMSFGEENPQGNGSISQIGTSPHIKQEVVDEICSNNNNNYERRPPSAIKSLSPSVDRELKTPQNNSPRDYPGRSSPEKIKREYLSHGSSPERTPRQDNSSRPESASRPESIVTSPTSLRGPESRLFQPDERMRNLHYEAMRNHRSPILHANDLAYPFKQVSDRFQPPSMVVERRVDPVMPDRFAARRDDELSFRERQQSFRRQADRGPSSLYGNEGVRQASTANYNRFQEKLGSGTNGISSDKSGQNVSKQPNGSRPPNNNSSKSTNMKKDEEPVWKTYQWYRDRKRPLSQQTKRQRPEQTIFMRYNEIRCKRVKEGKIIHENQRRASEPWLPVYRKEIDHTSPSSPKRPRTFFGETSQIGNMEHVASPQPPQLPQTPNCVSGSHGMSPVTSSTSPREIRHLENNVRPYSHERRSSDERIFNGKASYHCICGGRENGNFPQGQTTQHVIFSRDNVKPRTPDYTSNAKEENGVEISTNEEDEDGGLEKISSTTGEAENIEVHPDKLRRYPQDVAKILRLNRIVKAVRNNKKRQLSCGTTDALPTTMKKTKQQETNNNSVEHEIDDEALSAGQHQMHQENRNESDPEIDQSCDNGHAASEIVGDDDNEEDDESNSTRNFIDCFFFPERESRQMQNGMSNSFVYPQSMPDQESFSARQLNGLDAVQAQNDSDTVCQVNGLLSLPGFKETKYNITLGELKRRMNPPETLTRVEMISYVRQAKSSGRVLLDKNNIITANRSRPTVLSRVCESEAQVLADGIHKMNKEYLPLTTLARKTVETYKDDDCKDRNCEDCRLKLRRRIVDVEITRNSLKELHKVIEETRNEAEFQTFELASHTFGATNILNHLSLLDDYFRSLLLTLQDE